jgi:hypothetical protein
LNAGNGTTPSTHIKKLPKKRSIATDAESPTDSAFACARVPQNVSTKKATRTVAVTLSDANFLNKGFV